MSLPPLLDIQERPRPKQVCVFIDINMLAAIVKSPINFQRLKDWLVGQRQGVIFKAYCGETRNSERDSFYEYLRRLDFDVSVVHNTRSHTRSAKYDEEIRRAICCEIAWNMRDLLATGYYDTFVLVSGAFELATIISKVRQKGIEVEVAFFEDSCAPALRSRATSFRPLDMEKLTQMEARGEGDSTACFRSPKRTLVPEVARCG
jgi:hypothetical protein